MLFVVYIFDLLFLSKKLHFWSENTEILIKFYKKTLIIKMKPAVVADEMFPEGAGPFMDLDEVFLTEHMYCMTIMNIFTGWRIIWNINGLGG